MRYLDSTFVTRRVCERHACAAEPGVYVLLYCARVYRVLHCACTQFGAFGAFYVQRLTFCLCVGRVGGAAAELRSSPMSRAFVFLSFLAPARTFIVVTMS